MFGSTKLCQACLRSSWEYIYKVSSDWLVGAWRSLSVAGVCVCWAWAAAAAAVYSTWCDQLILLIGYLAQQLID